MEPVLNTPAEPISNAPTEPTLSTPPDTISDTPVEPTLNTPIPPSSSTPLQLPASPPTEITSSTPAEATSSVRKRKQLTRDQRLQIHTLRKAGHSYEFIVDFFKPDKVTFRQVAYAATQPIEPQNHKCGAKPKLDAETRRQVKDLMGKSTGPRPITYKEVSTQLGLGVSESTLRRARYESDSSTARPYQYDYKGHKVKPAKAKSKDSVPKSSNEEQQTGPAPPPPVVDDMDAPPASNLPADLAASWTASLQNFMRDHGPQPA